MKKYRVNVNGTNYEVELEDITGVTVSAPVAVAAPAEAAPAPAPAPAAAANIPVTGEPINAPMPGNILDVFVTVGQAIKDGDVLVILEAMKLENEIYSPCDGTIQAVGVQKGDTVNAGDMLVVIG